MLSVSSFSERIAHIKNEMGKHKLKFEFIFNNSIEQINQDENLQKKFGASNLSLAHKSLILKHIEAWENCVNNNYQRILVLEDDIILNDRFSTLLFRIIRKSSFLNSGYLIFLSGRDTRVPKEFLLSNDILFKLQIPTADGYITDLCACKKRLEWLKINLISLPADHLINQIHCQKNIQTYWSRDNLIEQGSVLGLFRSTLDCKRRSHTTIYNIIRYYLKIFTRRILRKIFYQIIMKKIR